MATKALVPVPDKKLPLTFAELVQMIIDRDHNGVSLQMAEHMRVATALIPRWWKGTVQTPKEAQIAKLVRLYDVDEVGLKELIYGLPGANPFKGKADWQRWLDSAEGRACWAKIVRNRTAQNGLARRIRGIMSTPAPTDGGLASSSTSRGVWWGVDRRRVLPAIAAA